MAEDIASPGSAVRVVDLRMQENGHPGFAGIARPALSWRLEADCDNVEQHAYEIEIARSATFAEIAAGSGRIEAPSAVAAAWPAPALASREVRWARVRAWSNLGATAWSTPLRIEAALLDADDWVARPISPQSNAGRTDPAPVPLLRRSFLIDRAVASARLYLTSLGVHETALNGMTVGDALLEPGWTAYRERLLYAAHDVTALLREGENVLSALVGDGWWRGWLTWLGYRAVYGPTTGLMAQLEVRFEDGSSMTVATGDGWRGATGALLAADLYDGCALDLRSEPVGWRLAGFDDTEWEDVESLPLPSGLRLRPMPPVRIVRRWTVTPRATAPGGFRIDTGQNLAGYLRLQVRGHAGSTLTIRHAEMLDNDGTLYTAPLRRAQATDRYVLADDAVVDLEPKFTIHGFRYAEIIADAGVEILAAEACVVASDLPQIGEFSCSDARVNQLYENVRWSQLGNFVALPTDCPQRDERLGWTGDIQVFAETACANADVNSFLGSWLEDLAGEQRADGCVTSTVPNVVPGFEYEYGGVGWGDAATLVPWALYEAYGDGSVLARQYDSMRAWVDWCASRRDAQGTWTGDFHLGDWLDPGAPPDRPEQATTSRDLIATAYLCHSSHILAKAAVVLGREDDESRYRALSDEVAAAAWRRWNEEARHTQAGAAIFLEFGIVPEAERRSVAQALARLVEANDGRIATGFLGTPLVLPALSSNGELEAAYRLLLNDKCPGWLYQVARGATTMWERWDAVGEDGRLHSGEMALSADAAMISFNHYAYGAVATWLYRTLAGIAPCDAHPGYRRIIFAPRPGGGITHATAQIATPYGKAAIQWRVLADGDLDVELIVPPGAQARFETSPGWVSPLLSEEPWPLGSGTHQFTLTPSQPALEGSPA